MTKPTILVAGATGKTGSAVALRLLQMGWPVRAIVHNTDSRSDRLRRAGAEVATADLFDPEQLVRVMSGTARAYYCPPWHPFMLQSAAAFAVAAQAARLEAIVGLSQWLASPSHPSLATRQNWLADHLFALLPGVAQITVNPGFFADNYLRLIGFAAQLGIFPMPTGGSRNAPPSTEDIANVVVAALTEPERHAGRTYRPTGPTLLSAGDMATILTRVLGRRVTHLDMPMWAFMRAARVLGISPFEQSGLRRYIEDHRRGAFEWGAPTADVWEVTGRPPEDFETIARRYASLPEARRTFGNGLRASADLLRIGLTPARNIDRYERDHHHPVPANPRLAAEDEAWRASHPLRVGPASATPVASAPA